MVILAFLIFAIALYMSVAVAIGLWLKKQADEYRKERQNIGKEASFYSFKWAKHTIKLYRNKYHPEGEKNLDSAIYKLGWYEKNYKEQHKKQEEA